MTIQKVNTIPVKFNVSRDLPYNEDIIRSTWGYILYKLFSSSDNKILYWSISDHNPDILRLRDIIDQVMSEQRRIIEIGLWRFIDDN